MRSRSPRLEVALVGLALLVPIPLLAVSGLSLPLPDAVERALASLAPADSRASSPGARAGSTDVESSAAASAEGTPSSSTSRLGTRRARNERRPGRAPERNPPVETETVESTETVETTETVDSPTPPPSPKTPAPEPRSPTAPAAAPSDSPPVPEIVTGETGDSPPPAPAILEPGTPDAQIEETAADIAAILSDVPLPQPPPLPRAPGPLP